MSSLTILFLLLTSSLSLALPAPQDSSSTPSFTPSPTAAATTAPTSTSVLPDPSGTSSSALDISKNSIIGIICGVVVLIIIAIGALFYTYRKYQQKRTKRRTAMVMDEMAANLNARIAAQAAKDKKQGVKGGHGRTGSVNVGKGKAVSGGAGVQGVEGVVVTELEVGSPVDAAMAALEGGKFARVGGRNGGW